MVNANIDHRFSRPYTPRDAGTVEAYNNTIKTIMLNVRLSDESLSLRDIINLASNMYNT
jgi:hypothetical protein